jgi:hypothetical protein
MAPGYPELQSIKFSGGLSMKGHRLTRSITLGLALVALLIGGCSGPAAENGFTREEAASASEPEGAAPTNLDLGLALPQVAAADQSAASVMSNAEETAGLRYMREEEKLAHDLYLAFYDIWGLPVFRNIAESEAAHTFAVLTLLNQYAIPDPAAGMAQGSFNDPGLQELYDTLLEQGSASLEQALRAAALVEEVDIQDLALRLGQTSSPQIEGVYMNLMSASENHLRAFVSQYSARFNQSYNAQVLPSEQVEAILAASAARGRGRNSN